MQDRAFADPKISFAFNREVGEIHEDGGKLAGLTLRDTVTGETSRLPSTGLFVAIGHDPRTDLVTGQLDLDGEGYLKVASPSTRTNIAGVVAPPVQHQPPQIAVTLRPLILARHRREHISHE
jgi:thioredoxin reductase (NADPH)